MWQVEFNTFAWSFLVSNTECGGEMFSEIRPNCGLQKNASFFTWQIKNKLLKASFTNERQPNEWVASNRILVEITTKYVKKKTEKLPSLRKVYREVIIA